MVLDITIQSIKKPFDINYRYHAYTVHADDHRILTIVTSSEHTLSKWLNDVVKATKNKHRTTPLLVGVSVERQSLEYTKGGVRDDPYDLLNLCVGSHCVIYYLPDPNASHPNPRSLRTFFDNPRVVALGMDMEPVAQKLERDHGIKIKNPVDLRSLAVEGLKRSGEHLDLWRYDLDKLAMTVLGKHVDVVRPEEKVEWYYDSIYYYWWCRKMRLEKVQFATIDAYLCFLVGSELHDMINGAGTEDSFSSKKKKKKKKRVNEKRSN